MRVGVCGWVCVCVCVEWGVLGWWLGGGVWWVCVCVGWGGVCWVGGWVGVYGVCVCVCDGMGMCKRLGWLEYVRRVGMYWKEGPKRDYTIISYLLH